MEMTIDLQETDFERLSFTELQLQEQRIANKYFIDCIFTGCDFTGSIFENCTFSSCKFNNCNLSLIKIPGCHIDHSIFSRCKMIGIDWTTAIWRLSASKRKYIFSNEFQSSLLNYSLFTGMDLSGIKITHCIAKEVYFENANIQQGDFNGSDLTGAIFNNCNLTRCDFSRALNYTINVTGNTMTKAKFSIPEAMALLYALDIELQN